MISVELILFFFTPISVELIELVKYDKISLELQLLNLIKKF